MNKQEFIKTLSKEELIHFMAYMLHYTIDMDWDEAMANYKTSSEFFPDITLKEIAEESAKKYVADPSFLYYVDLEKYADDLVLADYTETPWGVLHYNKNKASKEINDYIFKGKNKYNKQYVYVIMSGCCDDRNPHGVYSSLKKAQKAVKEFSDDLEQPDIVSFELNQFGWGYIN